MFKRFLKIIAFAYIYHLAKFGDLVSFGYSKIDPVLCTNTSHDVTDLANNGMIKNTKTWISREWNMTFLKNKRILNLCHKWHILRSYRFVVKVTFKVGSSKSIHKILEKYLRNILHFKKPFCIYEQNLWNTPLFFSFYHTPGYICDFS